MKNQKVDASAVQKMKAQFEEMPTRERLRPYDVIAQLAETIVTTQGRGYDVDDVMAVLRASGIELARNTVRTYLSRALATHGRSSPRLTQTSGSTRAAIEAPAVSPRANADINARARERAEADRPAALLSTNNSTANATPFKSSTDNAQLPGHFRVTPDRERL
jgi:hypothetical protein